MVSAEKQTGTQLALAAAPAPLQQEARQSDHAVTVVVPLQPQSPADRLAHAQVDRFIHETTSRDYIIKNMTRMLAITIAAAMFVTILQIDGKLRMSTGSMVAMYGMVSSLIGAYIWIIRGMFASK